MHCTGLIPMLMTHIPGFYHFDIKFKQTIGIFRFLKNVSSWKLAPKSPQKNKAL